MLLLIMESARIFAIFWIAGGTFLLTSGIWFKFKPKKGIDPVRNIIWGLAFLLFAYFSKLYLLAINSPREIMAGYI